MSRTTLSVRVLTIAGPVLAVSAAHWWTPRGGGHLLVVHTALAKLYVLPVVLAAIWFGMRSAAATAAAITALFLPHVFWQWAGDRTENVNQVGEIVTIWVTAVLTGAFAGREKASLLRLAAAYKGVVEALVAALDTREHGTSEHSKRVREYTIRLAQELRVPPDQQRAYSLAALLHDIGKIGIPDASPADSLRTRPGACGSIRRWEDASLVRFHSSMRPQRSFLPITNALMAAVTPAV